MSVVKTKKVLCTRHHAICSYSPFCTTRCSFYKMDRGRQLLLRSRKKGDRKDPIAFTGKIGIY